jgi:acyl-CoA synthetase (AMP-forming)/AMP-acid ligase II
MIILFSAVADWNYARTWSCIAAVDPGREALVGGDRRVTFGELADRARRLANALAAAGVGAGDAVAISLTNRPEYLETFFAALLLGAVPANLNYLYGAEELAHVLADCRPAAVVCEADARDRMHQALALVGSSGAVLAVDDDYERTLRAAEASAPAHVPSGDDRLLLYTGGTTGHPKGVVWRVDDYYLQGWEAARPGTTPPDPEAAIRAGKRTATLLPASPLVHATAFGMATTTLSGGGTVVLRGARRLDAAALWHLVAREHVAVLGIVGETFARPLLDALTTDPDVRALDCTSLRAIVSSGMAFSTSSKLAFLEHFPDLRIVDTLGASEALITRSEVTRGRAAAPATFAAKDNVRVLTDDGRDVAPGSGEDGVLAVAGRLPLGYLNDPEATARMFREIDGVRYATPGDRALVLADGRIELLGRGSACINTGGEKVYPEEVEQVLRTHPSVRDAAVVGVADDRWGEMVTALLEVTEDAALAGEALESDVRAHARARLAGYKVPKRCFAVESINRTVAGKPDYRSLRLLAAELATT